MVAFLRSSIDCTNQLPTLLIRKAFWGDKIHVQKKSEQRASAFDDVLDKAAVVLFVNHLVLWIFHVAVLFKLWPVPKDKSVWSLIFFPVDGLTTVASTAVLIWSSVSVRASTRFGRFLPFMSVLSFFLHFNAVMCYHDLPHLGDFRRVFRQGSHIEAQDPGYQVGVLADILTHSMLVVALGCTLRGGWSLGARWVDFAEAFAIVMVIMAMFSGTSSL